MKISMKAILLLLAAAALIQAKQARLSSQQRIEKNDDLKLIAREAAGVYSVKRLGLLPQETAKTFTSTIILTTANYAFRIHLQNFLCFADRLGLKVLVVSLDAEMNEFMRTSPYLPTTYFFNTRDFPWAQSLNYNSSVSPAFAAWNTKKYISMTNMNIALSHELMKLGYNVLLSDPDVVMVRDPFPLILWQNMDYVHTMEVTCSVNQDYNYFDDHGSQGNTGFTFTRSNNRTLHLWEQVIQAAIKDPLTNDQIHFWREIRSLPKNAVMPVGKCHDLANVDKNRDKLTLCVLNTCQYSSCSIESYRQLRRSLSLNHSQSITLHANCLIGDEHKMNELKKIGLWMATPLSSGTLSPSQCDVNWKEPSDDELLIRERIMNNRNANRRIAVRKSSNPAGAAKRAANRNPQNNNKNDPIIIAEGKQAFRFADADHVFRLEDNNDNN